MAHITTWENDSLYWRLNGHVDSKEILSLNEEAVGDARIQQLKYFIIDALDVETFDVNQEDANLSAIFSKTIHTYNDSVKGAFILQNDDIRVLVDEYIRHSHELGSTWAFKTFDNIEEAISWAAA